MPEPPLTGDAVLKLVRRAELADDDVLAGFLTRSGPLPAASDTATRLIQAGILTPFQAKLILQGKHKGFKLGPYRILNQIGAGGMGQVFLAEHAALRRRAALKVLPPRQAIDPASVERFYSEARAAAALDHPNIVHAYDVACDPATGTHFLVLEYIDGETLDRRLAAQGRLPVGEAVGYAVQAAAGLQHAHEKGVAHRDIKPSNLLVGRDGIVKILDLGLAQFFEESGTRLGRGPGSAPVMGTTDYVAPEQLSGAEADHRSDIYNLGATLYHLLSGRPPFTGTTAAKMIAHHLAPAPALHELSPDVPAELSAAVARMLAKDPAERHQSAAEVVLALMPFVNTPDSLGRKSGKLPPLAKAAAQESTANLAVDPDELRGPDEAAELAAALAKAQRTAKFAVMGMVAGFLFGAVSLALAVLVCLSR